MLNTKLKYIAKFPKWHNILVYELDQTKFLKICIFEAKRVQLLYKVTATKKENAIKKIMFTMYKFLVSNDNWSRIMVDIAISLCTEDSECFKLHRKNSGKEKT